MDTIRIGIVGVGPRGLTLLERIVANERAGQTANFEIQLFDPQEPGFGCHDPEQEDHLLVNTVAGQITQFSDSSVVGAGPILEGPSFHQWLQMSKPNVSANSYYSRGLFGRYLHWVFHYLCGLAPAHVKISFVKSAVSRIEREADTSWTLSTPDAAFNVNYLYLTTGHTKSTAPPITRMPRPAASTRPNAIVVHDPYPVKKKLAFVKPGMTVAIEGLGLTTFDVLADLTVGRGGRFVKDSTGHMHYLPSGNEPRLIAYSRSGLPLSARAVNEKGVSLQYKARFLFADKLRDLRATRKIDFATDVLPLLRAEMEYAYCESYLKGQRDPVSVMLFTNQFMIAQAEERQALIEQYIPEADRFSWDSLMKPVPKAALVDRHHFHYWLMDYLRADLAEAQKGNLSSPIKAASDVLRDLRDTLRAAIDFAGLTEASHRWLLSEFNPLMNRIAVGPPASRISEMLALVEAGVLDLSWGPNARCRHDKATGRMLMSSGLWQDAPVEVDALVQARISMHGPLEDASPLMRGLLDAGHVRPFYNGNFHPGGIEINREFNWVSQRGEVIHNAWALGIPVEGPKFYTFVVPRSGVNSTAIVDAGRAVQGMLAQVSGTVGVARPVSDAPLPTEEYASAFASLYGALG